MDGARKDREKMSDHCILITKFTNFAQKCSLASPVTNQINAFYRSPLCETDSTTVLHNCNYGALKLNHLTTRTDCHACTHQTPL